MKTALYADFLCIRQLSKTHIGLLLFFTLFATVTQSPSFLSLALVMICAMLPINLLSYDKSYRWDKQALLLPIPRWALVASKYLATLLVLGVVLVSMLGAAGIYCMFSPQDTFPELGLALVLCAAVTLLLLSIYLPILYRFGVEKGRYVILLLVWIPILFGFLLERAGTANPFAAFATTLDHLPISMFYGFAIALMLFALMLFTVSARVSISIFRKKEF